MPTTFSCFVPGVSTDAAEVARWSSFAAESHLNSLWFRVSPGGLAALVGEWPSTASPIAKTFVLSAPVSSDDLAWIAESIDRWPDDEVSLVMDETSSAVPEEDLRRSRRALRSATSGARGRRSYGRVRLGRMPSTQTVLDLRSATPAERDVDFVVVSVSAYDIAGSVGAELRRTWGDGLRIAALLECGSTEPPRNLGDDGAGSEREMNRARRGVGRSSNRHRSELVAEQLGLLIVAGVDEAVFSVETAHQAGGPTAALEQAREVTFKLPTYRNDR